MNILVLNCGSSSLKYRLIAMPEETELASGEAQRVGPPTAEPSRVIYRTHGGEPETLLVDMPNHAAAFDQILKVIARKPGVAPDAVGHRVVHGGAQFHEHTLVDDDVVAVLETVNGLAPLHNPPAVNLLKACRRHYPGLPQVAVFDTAFHATIPDHARTYALPRPIVAELGIRKYGFHGISHRYVVAEAAKYLNRSLETFNAVSCHLGSGGASLCAVVGGQSVDNTMGYSPLQGLIMSTRCGDLDPAVALRLLALSEGNGRAVEKALNEHSGVLGLSGSSADIRDALSELTTRGSRQSRLNMTAQVYLWRLRKYLGAYLAVAGQPQAIIFTDTVGETVPVVRWAMCADMQAFGVSLDAERNAHSDSLPADIATPGSQVRILVIQTNEELAIARHSYSVVSRVAGLAEKGVAA